MLQSTEKESKVTTALVLRLQLSEGLSDKQGDAKHTEMLRKAVEGRWELQKPLSCMYFFIVP